MARAKARSGRASGASREPRRSARNRQQGNAPSNRVPDVFHEMLAEEAPPTIEEVRPLKKRRVEKQTADAPSQPSPQPTISVAGADLYDDHEQDGDAPRLQTIIDDSETDDSEMDWEDVDLDQNNADYLLKPLITDPAEETLQIEIGNENTRNKPTRARRKAASAAERAVRLHLHKMHVLCLLYHSHIRNAWCNDEKVQASLKRFRSVQINNLFTPDSNQSQFQAAKAFGDGLVLALDAWKKFKITSLGMRRARWARDTKELEAFTIPADADPVMDIADFRKAAVAFEGSADTGAMLFCAFLRAVGVETRLVCSLQPLPFTAADLPTVETTPKDDGKAVYAENYGGDNATPNSTPAPLKRITRIGRPGLGSSSSRRAGTPSPAKPKKIIPHPRYPVYWVEAFNTAQQRWVTVDPIATRTCGKPSRIEPPLSDPDVCMTYAVAFEDDGVAKDVTRRYAKAYNAKTRKSRVESTENGAKWWRKALKLFRRKAVLDRDQVEDAELSRREAQEETPKNVQDFKDHPYYVLERHLRHNEVIHPKHEIGKVNIGSAANTNLEPIYRRRDVHQLKSADKWYRLGREIKPGEQPLKHAKPRRSRQKQPFGDEEDEDENLSTALYALFQTELYVPPPCVRGRVPRNAYGNLDVYVPSMVPPGGLHIRDSRARHAARLLGVDYADAVTGFNFRGRHGTAVIEGVVVAKEVGDAMHAALEGFRDLELDDEQARRSREALRMWKKFMLGLRVLERVQEYATADEKKQMEKEMRERIEAEEREKELTEREEQMAGGFLLAEGADQAPAEPTAGKMLAAAEYETEEYYDGGGGGGFLPEDTGEDGGEETSDLFKSRIMEDAPLKPRLSHHGLDSADDGDGPMNGGGFVPDEETDLHAEGAGGFIPEDGGGFVPESGGFIPENEGESGGSMKEDAVPENLQEDNHPAHEQESAAPRILAPDDTAVKYSPTTLEDAGVRLQPMDMDDTPFEEQPLTCGQDEVSQAGATAARESATAPQLQPQVSNVGLAPNPEASKAPSQLISQLPLDEAAEERAVSDDDADSLPSHDPEDEDAEPEWLAEEVVSD